MIKAAGATLVAGGSRRNQNFCSFALAPSWEAGSGRVQGQQQPSARQGGSRQEAGRATPNRHVPSKERDKVRQARRTYLEAWMQYIAQLSTSLERQVQEQQQALDKFAEAQSAPQPWQSCRGPAQPFQKWTPTPVQM